MNDSDRRESGHLMLISPERVFYAGLLGRPRKRTSGGFNIYASMRGQPQQSPTASREADGELAVVPPYLAHTVESDHPSVICLVIEPETVAPAAMDALSAEFPGPRRPTSRSESAPPTTTLRQRRAPRRLHHRRVRPDLLRRDRCRTATSIRRIARAVARLERFLRQSR